MQEIGSFIIDIVDLFAVQMIRVQGSFLRIDLSGALLMVLIGFYRINVSRSWSFEHFSSDQLQRMHRMHRIIGSSDLRITPQRWDQKRCNEVLVLFSDLSFFSLSLTLSLAHTRARICTNALLPWHLWTNLVSFLALCLECSFTRARLIDVRAYILASLSLLTYFFTSRTFSIFCSTEIMKIINYVMRLF